MSGFSRTDYLRIKWSFVALALSVALGGGMFTGLSALDERANTDLRRTRAAYDDAVLKVTQIEQEEASIRQNIVQYQEIAAAGLVEGENRLQMREHFVVLWAEHSLFPITLEIGEQQSLPIKYGELDGKKVDDPGRPIALQISEITFSLPLLHENDLNNLLNFMVTQPELVQPQRCSLEANGGNQRNYLRLGQHFRAECILSWYTFRIDDASTETTNE